ncbi:MAG: ABC-three component system protein [Terriglobia bacterium]
MTKEQFALHYHEILLERELFRRTGRSFQDFFEQIMQRADPSFMMVRPMGREGDWKADGYSLNSKTIYQCYAPEEMTGSEASNKVVEDFEGARRRWQDRMQRWVFVWSSERALPPQVISAVASLKANHPALDIDQMGRAGLWDIVKGLPLADRQSLLEVVPDLSAAAITTAVDIQFLMKHLGQQPAVTADTTDLDLTAIAEKLQRNRLSEAVTNMVRPSIPVARLVHKFVTAMPEPAFSHAIAVDLAGKYTELAASTDDPDIIFDGIIEYVRGEHHPDPKFFWAAAGIVAYYFELCDIFEK